MKARLIKRLPSLRRLVFLVSITICCFAAGCGGAPSSPVLESLTLSPSPYRLSMGTTGQLKATGKFRDGKQRDLTNAVLWKTDGAKIALVSSAGVVKPVAAGQSTVSATYGTVVVSASLIVDPADLVSIEVTPHSMTLPLGRTTQLKAMGHYSDSTTVDITGNVTWQSDDPAIAAVSSNGQAMSKAVGSAKIIAKKGGQTGSGSLSIAPADLVSIAVSSDASSLPVGIQTQMRAQGTFTDNSSQDVSTAVTWSSSSPGVIAITGAGVAQAKSLGMANITATSGTIAGAKLLTATSAALKKIDVSSARSSFPIGEQTQMQAQGTFSDNSSQDISTSVTWGSSAPPIIAVSSAGVAQAKAVGASNITATLGNIGGSKALIATTAALTKIEISPTGGVLPVGTTAQLTATGNYSDNSKQDITTLVQWSSSPQQVLTVSNSGLATANAVGSATVVASLGSVSSADMLSVSPAALVSVAVMPQSTTVPMGQRQQFTLTGTYTDQSQRDLTGSATWSSDNSQIATVDSTGVAVGMQVGKANIQGAYQDKQGTGGLNVQPLLTVNYFNSPADAPDTTLQVAQSSDIAPQLCAMIYVFDADQQMSECCGCVTSHDGLMTLSYQKDLLSNPLTGVKSLAGTVVVVAADQANNSTCDASAMTPLGSMTSWSTSLEPAGQGQYTVQESPASASPLSDTQSSSFQAQCYFIKTLGSGQGTCSCGSGDRKALGRGR